MYPPEMIIPMKEQLERVGFESLTSADEVDAIINEGGTTLLVITRFAVALPELCDREYLYLCNTINCLINW